jgi:hypothetical protein
MNRVSIILLVLFSLLIACSTAPDESSIQTAIALTNVTHPKEMPSLTPSSTATFTPTQTYTSTFTLTPTLTPTLTNTPIPSDMATATAFEKTKEAKYFAETATQDAYVFQLTATKEASFATQTQIVEDAESAYVVKALEYIYSYLTNLQSVGTYTSMAGIYPNLLLDSDWISDMKGFLREMTSYSYKMSTIYPVPERFSSLEVLFTELYSESYNLEVDMVRGIDYLDSDAIERATVHMENIGTLSDELTAALE